MIRKYAMRFALVAVGATFGLTGRAIGAQAGAVGTGGIKGQIHDSLGIGIAGVEITLDAGTRAFGPTWNARSIGERCICGKALSVSIPEPDFRSRKLRER